MFESNTPAVAQTVVTVSELNRLAKEALEQNLPLMWIAGEISNFRRYDSGHCYFTLKDAAAQVDCVLFRHKAQHLDWAPENGMQVEVRAYPSLYEARGRFQLNVEVMRRSGRGALYEAFEKLKARLAQEGLFDAALKRPLPRFPRTIGVVTSPQAAALRDVLTTLKRRMPGTGVIIYPAPVQGEGAAAKIAQAIATAGSRDECDVLIVCRGGGSIEDLWAFNEEAVARAIRACPIPVVAGVGHETDVTITDFAADARAPTPTAAAAMASPDRAELTQQMAQWRRQLARLLWRGLEERMQRVDFLAKRLVHPGERIRIRRTELVHLASRLRGAWQRVSQEEKWRLRNAGARLRAAAPDLEALGKDTQALSAQLVEAMRRRMQIAADALARIDAHLRHLSPQQVLERGYSITAAADGKIVRDADRLTPDEEVTITFARGSARAQVKSKKS